MRDARRNHLFLPLVFGLVALVVVSAIVVIERSDSPESESADGTELTLQARAAPPQATNESMDRLTDESMDRSVDLIRSDCRPLGTPEIEVSRRGPDRIVIGVPAGIDLTSAVECATTSARLGFYSWEDNLLGPARELVPGADARDPEAVWAQVRSNWIAAGRQPGEGQNRAFIVQGAEPTIWNAVQLASQQKRVDDCTRCLSSDKFYLFEEKAPHKLISGPVANRSDLYFDSKGQPLPERGIVETVPQGTIVVEDLARDLRTGSRITDPGQAGFFVLEDDPELTGADIETPKLAANPTGGGPVVTFGFTEGGIEAFGKMTERLAKQGMADASGPGGFLGAESVSESFAIILDDQVLDRLVVNFLEYPDGIDGRTGFQIYGGFDSETTRALVRYLRRGAMPVELTLTGQKRVRAGGAESGSD